ncbi:MAG: hypothetical protein HY901_24635 [Deltaproteobacteria bacterium]|nr:hypothetical protein [Deltaproteobacteria bacterium]
MSWRAVVLVAGACLASCSSKIAGLSCESESDCSGGSVCWDGVCTICAAVEDCTNGFDDNCDGLADCVDPQCGGQMCRLSRGECDPAEYCLDGHCPADRLVAAQALCREETACNLPASCDGTSPRCPPLEVKPASDGVECRVLGGCAKPASCHAGICPPNEPLDVHHVCREAQGCAQEAACDGVSLECPAGAVAEAGSPCTTPGDAFACEAPRECDGTSSVCPASDGAFAEAGTLCRPARDPLCDVPERCDGTDSACPPDAVAQKGSQCRPPQGECDLPAVCDGVQSTCPANGLLSRGTPCRDAAGICDLPESCDGASPQCPEDLVAPAETLCRESMGECDLPETCDGRDVACPIDQQRAPGEVCRPAAGPCDEEERCAENQVGCPADGMKQSGTECGPAIPGAECDLPDLCSGSSAECTAQVKAAGTVCRAAPSANRGDCVLDALCDGASSACGANPVKPAGTPCTFPNACKRPGTCSGTLVDPACSVAVAEADHSRCGLSDTERCLAGACLPPTRPIMSYDSNPMARDLWEWENPFPQGNTLRAVALPALYGDVVFAGDAGTVLLDASGNLQRKVLRNATGALERVNFLSACSSGQLTWALGAREDFTPVIANSSDWNLQTISSSSTPGSLRALWCAPTADTLVAVGDNGKVAIQEQNGVWRWESTDSSLKLRAVWGRSLTDLWAVGTKAGVWHRSAQGWAPVTCPVADPASVSFAAVSGDDQHVWIAAQGGERSIFLIDHNTHECQAQGLEKHPPGASLTGLWVYARNAAWAVSTSGTNAYRMVEGFWYQEPVGLSAPFNAVASSSDGEDVWVVGAHGAMAHRTRLDLNSGYEWLTSRSVTSQSLRAAWGWSNGSSSSTDVVAVGDAAATFRRGLTGGWTRMANSFDGSGIAAKPALVSVIGSSTGGELIAVGTVASTAKGVVLRWLEATRSWQPVDLHPPSGPGPLTAVAASQNDWILGGDDGYWWNRQVSPDPSPSFVPLSGITALVGGNGSEVWMGLETGLQKVDLAAAIEPDPTFPYSGGPIRALWRVATMGGAETVFAVGDGRTLRFDVGSGTVTDVVIAPEPHAVWAGSPGTTWWVVGDRGLARRLDSGGLDETNDGWAGTYNNLYATWGASALGIGPERQWAVGEHGTVLIRTATGP